MRLSTVLCLIAAVLAFPGDWPYYGGGPEQIRYSPLTQINAANVTSLKVAWTYDTGDAFEGSEMQCQPVVANGVLFATSPKLRVFALDAATGTLKWSFSPDPDSKAPSRTRIRGLMYWERGTDRRIYFGARNWLYALDANTGKPVDTFGKDGRIDLREGFRKRDPHAINVGLNTPGVFYGDLLIIGSIVPEGLPSAPGDVRAFDVRTGKQKWAFHTIPQPGEFGYDTWPKDAWKYAGGANAWSGISLDEKRGLVFAATGSTSYDFYGANRHGDNLFANSILCLRAATGERLWHFQAIKHDLWDRDFPAPPALITITKNGTPIDVVAQVGKNGNTYVLDRETGAPIYPMKEVTAPASDVEGELAATHAAHADAAATFHAPAIYRRSDDEADGGGREIRARALGAASQRRRVRSTERSGHGPLSGDGRWCRVGRGCVRSEIRPALCECERDGVDRQAR